MKRIAVILIYVVLALVNLSDAGYLDQLTNAVSGVWCKTFKCCDSTWKNARISELTNTLKSKVYGQHIAVDYITNSLRSHIKGKNDKPLVLSFHGMPGVGKTYVTNIIKKTLFKYGDMDSHIHMFSGRHHFRIAARVELYQEQLASWVRGNVSDCAASLFVFDEVEEIPPGVLDAIKPYLDYHSNIDGVDFRNSVFIFISNTGDIAILDKMVDLYNNGRKREDLSLSDFEDLIQLSAFNEKGGLQESDMVSHCVIGHYIPFLPLEQQHVRECIKEAFRNKGVADVSNDDIQEIMQHIAFGPEKSQLFSKSGCKRVEPKVNVVLEKKRQKYGEL